MLALLGHHGTPPSSKLRLQYLLMGRGQRDKATWQGPEQRKWHVWDGAYTGSYSWSPQAPSRQPAFPRYDDKRIAKSEGKGQKYPRDGWDGEDPTWPTMQDDDPLAGNLQACINQTRKAENKVRQLLAAQVNKKESWQRYELKLKKSYQQEKQRFQQSLRELDEALQKALHHQEVERAHLRSVAREEVTSTGREQALEQEWARMTTEWQQEFQETEAPDAVLKRAMAAEVRLPPSFGGPPLGPPIVSSVPLQPTPAHAPGSGMPPASKMPPPGLAGTHNEGYVATAAPKPPLPHSGSPGAPTGVPSEGTTPSPGQRSRAAIPRAALKARQLQPVKTTAPGDIAAKLEQKRAMQPFLGAHLHGPPPGGTAPMVAPTEGMPPAAIGDERTHAAETGSPSPLPGFLEDDEDMEDGQGLQALS